METADPGLREIQAARAAIAPHVVRTPLARVPELGRRLGCDDLRLKLENLQVTGSFKIRGALNCLMRMTLEERARGVVAVSAGNHAQGVAHAASLLGARATVVMPENASPFKVERTKRYGARVILHGTVQDAIRRMGDLVREERLVPLHPYDDPRVVAGQGTVGLEIHEDCPDAGVVLVGVGGGGVISGLAIALKALNPGVRIVGVEPEGAPALYRSLREGRRVTLDRIQTMVDGLCPPDVGEINFRVCRRLVDETVLVTDDEVREGIRVLLDEGRVLAEPAGAAAFSALLAGKIKTEPAQKVVAVVSGGNMGLERLKTFL